MAHTTQIDPVILAKIRAFGRRRRRLIVLRGLCAAIVSLLGAMSLIVIPDYLLVLADSTRLWLSVAAYTIALAAVWITCLRALARFPDQRQLATLMEATDPALRENVLAAIELGAVSDERFDSPVFRGLVQQHVAGKLSGVSIAALLPWRLVSGWMLACAAVVLICGSLAAVPGLSYPSMLARALAPTADIERASSVKVAIVEPSSASALAPEGDAVRIVAETSGGLTEEATLEVFTPDGQRQKLPMTRQADRRFAGTFVIGKDPVSYRVLAGDGATRRHHIASRPRPYATAFEKTYRFPTYTQLPPTSRTEKDGDLAALEGTEVDLVIQTDQPVTSGELRIEGGRENVTIPLRIEAGRVTATLPVKQSGAYQVHLVAAETRFENRFSPKYEISAQADLPPRVELSQPAQNLLLPPDEIVGLKAAVQDDLAIVSVEQMIRINQGAWKSLKLADEPGAAASVDKAWDLFDLKLRAGDVVTTKIAATDRKGSRGESTTITVTISSAEFDLKRLGALEAKTQAQAVMAKFAALVEQHRRAADEAVPKLQALPPDSEQARAYIDTLSRAVAGVQADGQQALTALLPLIRQVAKGSDAHDLSLAAQGIARVQHDNGRAAAWALAASGSLRGSERDKLLRTVLSEMREAQSEAAQLQKRLGDIAAAELLAVVVNDLRTLAVEQARTELDLRQIDPTTTWRRVARRQGVAGNQTRFLEDLLLKHPAAAFIERSRLRPLTDILRQISGHREAIEKLLAEGPPDQRLTEPSRRMREGIDNLHRVARAFEAEESRRLSRNRRGMEERTETARKALESLSRDMQDAAKLMQKLEDPKKAPRDIVQLESERARLAELNRRVHEHRHPAAIALLKSRGAIEEARPDSDARLAADIGLVARGVETLHTRFLAERDVDPEGLRRVAELVEQTEGAYRVLMGVAKVREIGTAAAELGGSEQWKLTTPLAHTLHPRQWDFIAEQPGLVSREIRWNKAWQNPARELEQVRHRPPAQQTQQEMDGRRAVIRPAETREPQLQAVKADIDRILAMMQPEAERARTMLETISPKLPQLMRSVAEAAKKQEQRTRDAAEQARQAEPKDAAAPVAQLRQEQEALKQRMTDVHDALRQQANLQNLMTQQGRDEARDADAARAMLKEAQQQTDAALEKAAEAAQPVDQQRSLEQAAKRQQETAAMLEKLAEHYEKMAAGQNVADSRQQMREAERQAGVERALDEQYQQLERLSELSQMKPAELMKALEDELKQNRPMQRELSEISRSAVQQAQADLAKAAEMERQQAQKVQQAAEQQTKMQNEAAKQLEQMKRQARELAEKKAPDAANAAQQAQMQQPAASVASAQKDLDEAARKLPEKPDASMQKTAEQVSEAAKPLAMAAEDLRQAEQQASQSAETMKKEAAAAKQQAEAAAQQAQAMQQQQPGAPAAEQAKQHAAQAKAQAEAMQKKSEQASAAQQKTKDAAAQARQLADQARQMAESMKKQADAARQQMVQAAGQQQPVAQKAEQAAEDVARASRHEMRLGNEPAAEQLQQQAQQTMQTAKSEVPEAQRELMQAAEASKAQPKVQKAAESLNRQAQQLAQMTDSARPTAQPTASAEPSSAAMSEAKPAAEPAAKPMQPGEPAPTNTAAATPAQGQPAPGQPMQGQPTPSGEPGSMKPSAQTASKPPTSDMPTGGSKFEGASAEFLARALDQLDKAMNSGAAPAEAANQQMAQAAQNMQQQGQNPGQPQPGQNQPGSSTPSAAQASAAEQAVQQALQAAAAAQAANMQADRAAGLTPGEAPLAQSHAAESTKGAAVEAGNLPYQGLPTAKRVAENAWGKLPPQLAKDLAEGRRENISPEYRAMVEAYFRAVAAKARGEVR